MRNKLISIIAACAMTAALAGSAWAQTADTNNNRIGTSAATELLIPVGARDLALGGSSIATSSGVDALHWNPAGLGRMTGSAEGFFSTMAYIADITTNYGAVGLNFGGFGKIAISVKALDFGDIPFTTVDDPEGVAGRTFTPSFFTLGFSYARAFTDAITMGGSLKLVSEDMNRVTGSGVAIDLGVQYNGVAGFKGLHLGVALKNIGPQVNFDGSALLRLAQAADGRRPTQFFSSEASSWELPTSVDIGLAYTRSVNESVNYLVSGAFVNNNLALDTYKAGGEVNFTLGNVVAAVRGGAEVSSEGADDNNIFGPSFGFGFLYKTSGTDITIDYAYRSVDFFDANNMFSLKLGF